MDNISALEACYRHYMNTVDQWPKDSFVSVDLDLLRRYNLLNYQDMGGNDPALTQYFHVIESEEKITLINERFVVWIVPQRLEDVPVTCTIIAMNEPADTKFELAFLTSGVYNTSKLVLRLLEKFLHEIEENNDTLSGFD